MSVVNWAVTEGVGHIVMTNGENRHNPGFLKAINDALDGIEADPSAQAVILSSNDPKYWSLGIDLGWIMAAAGDETRREELKAFIYGVNHLFKRILSYPMPVIAAIAGHAFGNGANVACACDFRFMLANRGFFCFPEVDVNIPFLYGMYAIVRKAVPAYKLEEMALTGRRISGKEAAEHHIVYQAHETPEKLMEAATVFAKSFNKGRAIFREQKVRNHKAIFEAIDRDDPPLIDALKLVM